MSVKVVHCVYVCFNMSLHIDWDSYGKYIPDFTRKIFEKRLSSALSSEGGVFGDVQVLKIEVSGNVLVLCYQVQRLERGYCISEDTARVHGCLAVVLCNRKCASIKEVGEVTSSHLSSVFKDKDHCLWR